MANFYNGIKLLNTKDLNGNKPEIFISTSNRSGGKTTWFNDMVLTDYKENKNKFVILVRFGYELEGCADTFFKGIKEVFSEKYCCDEMTEKVFSKGIFATLYLNKVNCGYVVPLNMADQIKKKSHLLSDAKCILFDEFQSETGHYCPDEITKFLSIHQSIARGGGKQSRYLPVYMLSNLISVLNPYYTALKINDRLQPDTRFLRGNGWVLEQGFNNSAVISQKSSLFNMAFSDNEYMTKGLEKGKYLNDSNAFIEQPPKSRPTYLFTVIYKNKYYAVRRYSTEGLIYIDNVADINYPHKIALDNADHSIETVLYPVVASYIPTLRRVYDLGCFRFRDLQCKEIAIKLLRYY